MRSRQEILSDTLEQRTKTPSWDTTASLHERLMIEVFVDVRDELSEIRINLLTLTKHIETWLPKPPGL